MEFTLSKNQQSIFDFIEANSCNVWVNGSPGVGKSVLINALVELGKKHYVLAAPTGLAALNISGKTLHSVFRLPTSQGVVTNDYDVYPTDTKALAAIKYMKHLIIDEISMVRADQFAYIDRLMRYAKGNSAPFGGAQVIVVGDFFQLPPVVLSQEKKLMKEEHGSDFVFSCSVFNTFKRFDLTEVLRQKGDDTFIKILHETRTGRIHPKSLGILNKGVTTEVSDYRIRLTGTNQQAQAVNDKFLAALETEEVVFHCEESGNWPAYPAEKELKLKVGAQVMVKKNKSDVEPGSRDFSSEVVNGTMGIVTAIRPECSQVDIQLKNGSEVTIYRQEWQRKVKQRNDYTGKWEEIVLASFSQVPLSVAYAVSMHKSQGQSFDQVHVDASKIFAAGQLYVALSRCRSLEGLSLEVPLTPRMFFTNPDVVEFFDSIEV